MKPARTDDQTSTAEALYINAWKQPFKAKPLMETRRLPIEAHGKTYLLRVRIGVKDEAGRRHYIVHVRRAQPSKDSRTAVAHFDSLAAAIHDAAEVAGAWVIHHGGGSQP